MFITFEGIDGSGKTTCIKKIKEYIETNNLDVNNFLFTREPGGFNLRECEQIRQILLDKNNEIDSMTEMLLYLASRKMHVEKLIRPALKENKIVFCDRFYDSSIAYQGNARMIGMDKVENINLTVLDNFKPNYTFYFRIDSQTSAERMARGNRDLDRLELAQKSFFDKAIEGYETLAKKEPQRFIIIDAKKETNLVFEEVINKLKKIIKI